MSHATQVEILRHGRLALAELARAPIGSTELARKLNVDDRVARRLLRDLQEAGHDIQADRDGRRIVYSIGRKDR